MIRKTNPLEVMDEHLMSTRSLMRKEKGRRGELTRGIAREKKGVLNIGEDNFYLAYVLNKNANILFVFLDMLSHYTVVRLWAHKTDNY